MDIWFKLICDNLEVEHGYGWKQKLAEIVGVSSSNVQSWIKAGRVPPAVKTAIVLYQKIEYLEAKIKILDNNKDLMIAEVRDSEFPFQVLQFNEEDEILIPISGHKKKSEAQLWRISKLLLEAAHGMVFSLEDSDGDLLDPSFLRHKHTLTSLGKYY